MKNILQLDLTLFFIYNGSRYFSSFVINESDVISFKNTVSVIPNTKF